MSTCVLCACHHGAAKSERTPISFDNRTWTAIQRAPRPSKDRDFIVEYLPQGQTAENWTELLGFQHFHMPPGTQASAREFAIRAADQLKQGAAPNYYQDKPLFASPNEYVMDMVHSGTPVEENLIKILAVGHDPMHPQAIDVTTYTKKTALTDAERKRWVGLLQQSSTDQFK